LKPLSRLGLAAGWIGAPSAIEELSARSVILTPLRNCEDAVLTHGFEC
jgi:hypothetical protein